MKFYIILPFLSLLTACQASNQQAYQRNFIPNNTYPIDNRQFIPANQYYGYNDPRNSYVQNQYAMQQNGAGHFPSEYSAYYPGIDNAGGRPIELLRNERLSMASSPQQANPYETPRTQQEFRLPEGLGCSGEIARFRAIQANDLSMGHVATKVYDQVEEELKKADTLCSEGRNKEVSDLIRRIKHQFGYP